MELNLEDGFRNKRFNTVGKLCDKVEVNAKFFFFCYILPGLLSN